MSEQRWKLGNEFLPYHPDASHVSADYRDGWNDCYRRAAAPGAWRLDTVLGYTTFKKSRYIGKTDSAAFCDACDAMEAASAAPTAAPEKP